MATTLKGSDDIYAAVNVLDDPRQYKSGPNKDKDYYLGQWNGLGFTCSEEFYRAYKAGTLQQVTFSEGEYQPVGPDGKPRVDPLTGLEMTKRKSATLGGFTVTDQVLGFIEGKTKLTVAEAKLKAAGTTAGKIAERAAYLEANIPKDEMLELLKMA